MSSIKNVRLPVVVIIGGGATGTGIARVCAERGLTFVLIERGQLGSGTSGRFHGMLHSGARYAVADPAVAAECYQENQRLRIFMPSVITDTGGLFVAVTEQEAAHADIVMAACRTAGIPCKEISLATARAREPLLSPAVVRAFTVPDGFIDGQELIARNKAAAPGRYITNATVTGLQRDQSSITAVTVTHANGEQEDIAADYIINAAGVWAGRIAELAELPLETLFDKGTMIVFKGALSKHVLNRCRPESDGDLLVSHGNLSIMGTTARVIADPDEYLPTQEEADVLVREGSLLVPQLASAEAVRIYAGVRPLLRPNGALTNVSTRSISRAYEIIDHAEQGIDNMVSIVGGKVTLHRRMAEVTVDLLEQKL